MFNQVNYSVPFYVVSATAMVKHFNEQRYTTSIYDKEINDIVYNDRYNNDILRAKQCNCVVNTAHLLFEFLDKNAREVFINNPIPENEIRTITLLIVNAVNGIKRALQSGDVSQSSHCMCKKKRHGDDDDDDDDEYEDEEEDDEDSDDEFDDDMFKQTYKCYIALHEIAEYLCATKPELVQSMFEDGMYDTMDAQQRIIHRLIKIRAKNTQEEEEDNNDILHAGVTMRSTERQMRMSDKITRHIVIRN